MRPRSGASTVVAFALAFALAAVDVACSNGVPPAPTAHGSTSASPGAGIATVERDFAITLGSPSAPEGSVSFDVTNRGPSIHELLVLRTALPADRLPVISSESRVDEQAKGVTPVALEQDIAPGSEATLTVTLAPGHYAVICNLPRHYQSGMRADLSVTG